MLYLSDKVVSFNKQEKRNSGEFISEEQIIRLEGCETEVGRQLF